MDIFWPSLKSYDDGTLYAHDKSFFDSENCSWNFWWSKLFIAVKVWVRRTFATGRKTNESNPQPTTSITIENEENDRISSTWLLHVNRQRRGKKSLPLLQPESIRPFFEIMKGWFSHTIRKRVQTTTDARYTLILDRLKTKLQKRWPQLANK